LNTQQGHCHFAYPLYLLPGSSNGGSNGGSGDSFSPPIALGVIEEPRIVELDEQQQQQQQQQLVPPRVLSFAEQRQRAQQEEDYIPVEPWEYTLTEEEERCWDEAVAVLHFLCVVLVVGWRVLC
jgi:hypothetical protein